MAAAKKTVLIVGTGSIGERHLRCFLATGRATVSVCETNDELRQSVAERYDVESSFADLDKAAVHGFDAAVIATPAHTHIPLAQKLAEAGMHLLIEKPLSISDDGIDQLEQTAAEKKLVVAIGFVLRTQAWFADMRQAIRSQRFGRPLQVVVNAGQHFPTYRPAYREIYYADRKRGGGAIQDAITHMLNMVEWFVGPVESIVADAAHQRLEGVTVEDTVHLIARHGPVLASYTLNQYQAPNETTVTVVCERGTLRAEPFRSRWRWIEEVDTPWHDEPVAEQQRDGHFIQQADAFLDAIEGHRPPLCTLAEGRQTMRATLAALQSADDMEKFIHIPQEPTP